MGGVQEPAAALFSALNLLAHAQGLRILRRIPAAQRCFAHGWSAPCPCPTSALWSPSLPRLSRRVGGSYVALGVISMNAWVWASIFHTRDRPLSEALDYHSASAVQLAGCLTAMVTSPAPPPACPLPPCPMELWDGV